MTNETQQTAVEWLSEQISDYLQEKYDIDYFDSKLLEQAKEMEKKQIIDAYNQSWHFRDKPYETAQKYHNETYGGNK
jgi:hypothetical protein